LINTSWEANPLGFDFRADKQTEIRAVCGGVIKRIKTASKAVGKYVEIEHSCGGKTFLGFYGHIDADPGLKEGLSVPADTLKIGTMADWGTNSHLHLSIFVGGDSEWWRNFYCRKNEYTEETLEGKPVRTFSSCTAVAPAKDQSKDYYTLLSGYGWLKKSVSYDTGVKTYLYVPRQTIIS
jgi:murein DD-endopeptidase MepM/ murein hydrolase activator NlpD